MRKTLSRIIDIIRVHKSTIIRASIIAIIIEIINLIKPYIVKIAIDDYYSFGLMIKNGISVFTLMAIYIALVLIGGAIDFYNRVQTNALGETILEELRKKVYKYSQLTNISFHNQMPAGKMYARIINDVDDVSAMFKDVIATLFRDIASIIIILTFIFIINWKIGLMLLIILPFTIKTSKLISDQINRIYKK